MRDPQPPQVTAYEKDDVRVIVPVGEFDIASLEPFRDAILDAVTAGQSVVLDMSETAFVDSTVLGAIAAGRVQTTQMGGWLRIVAPRPNIGRVLQLIAFDTVIDIYPTVEEALAHPPEPAGAG